MKKIALLVLKSTIMTWITSRALVCPAAKKAQLMAKYNVPSGLIDDLQTELQAQALSQVDKIA